MAIAREGLTLEEFLALPEEKPALEYVDGVVTQKVAPFYEHSDLTMQLLRLLDAQLGPRGLAKVLPELRTTYSGRSYVPDISVFRRERLPRRTKGQPMGHLFLLPDLAIEIILPGQRVAALARKCQWYVDHGAQVALLVDDRHETIRAFRPGVPPVVHPRGDRIALDEIVPGLHLVVDDVFVALDPD